MNDKVEFVHYSDIFGPLLMKATTWPEVVSELYTKGFANSGQRKPLTITEVEQILAQHDYEIHGDRARYIVRMTEEAHGIGEKP